MCTVYLQFATLSNFLSVKGSGMLEFNGEPQKEYGCPQRKTTS